MKIYKIIYPPVSQYFYATNDRLAMKKAGELSKDNEDGTWCLARIDSNCEGGRKIIIGERHFLI